MKDEHIEAGRSFLSLVKMRQVEHKLVLISLNLQQCLQILYKFSSEVIILKGCTLGLSVPTRV